MSRPKSYTGIDPCCVNCQYFRRTIYSNNKRNLLGEIITYNIAFCSFDEDEETSSLLNYQKNNVVTALHSCDEFVIKQNLD